MSRKTANKKLHDKTVLSITKALSKTTNYTCRAEKVAAPLDKRKLA